MRLAVYYLLKEKNKPGFGLESNEIAGIPYQVRDEDSDEDTRPLNPSLRP